jgi:GntR family transcriptional regulator
VALGDKLVTVALVESTSNVRLPDDLGMPCAGTAAPAYHFLRRFHTTDERPFSIADVYIEANVFARDPDAFRHGTSLPVLDRFPDLAVSTARQRLSIHAAGEASAGTLALPVGAPVAELRRYACVGETIVYYACMEFPTEYVCLDFDLLDPGGG